MNERMTERAEIGLPIYHLDPTGLEPDFVSWLHSLDDTSIAGFIADWVRAEPNPCRTCGNPLPLDATVNRKFCSDACMARSRRKTSNPNWVIGSVNHSPPDETDPRDMAAFHSVFNSRAVDA